MDIYKYLHQYLDNSINLILKYTIPADACSKRKTLYAITYSDHDQHKQKSKYLQPTMGIILIKKKKKKKKKKNKNKKTTKKKTNKKKKKKKKCSMMLKRTSIK